MEPLHGKKSLEIILENIKNDKLDKDLKERQELLEAYKIQIANLKKKLQDHIDEEKNEESVE